MVDTNMMERFSLAYLEAVASQAGCWIADPRIDRNSVDGVLMGEVNGLPSAFGFQAKATSQDVLREDHISFRLPMRDYNHLRLPARFQRILIVLRMPDETDEWLNQTDEELCMRHCAYWRSLRDEPEVPNTSSVSIHVPLANMFNSGSLAGLMDRAARGEPL